MYEKDGEKYFIVDSHMHYWDASPENWVAGTEQYAKGWIECFHAYQGLGPPDTHWTIEHFMKYSEEDLMKDVFEDGYVDVAIFQPTYLKEWYSEGFNTTEQNGALAEKHPGKFIVNTRFDPRDGDAGIKELEANVARWGSKGVKLYTAEWNDGSRGWTLKDPEAYRFLEKARSSASRTSTCTRARRSGRWTRTRSTCPTSTTPRRTSRSSTSSSSTSACRASRTSASWRRRSPTCTPVCPSSSVA